METRLHFDILPQPDDTTCGPTCLHAIYSYYGDSIPLSQVIGEVTHLEEGGTMASLLGSHALRRGYRATLYTFDMRVFDPTWFALPEQALAEKLRQQLTIKHTPKMEVVTNAYLDFLQLGGKIVLADLSTDLIRGFLKKDKPIVTGLSATFLYRSAREVDKGNLLVYDDLHGEPVSHFVVLAGYDSRRRSALVADPYRKNPLAEHQHYEVRINRLIPAIMLATITYDANLLIIDPAARH